jgi:sarcosine oxidase
MNSTYEHIVLGAGGIGSAAAYWLARRGRGSVLAVEQYRLGRDRGASEDHSRIIRHSYHTTEYTSLTRAVHTDSGVFEAGTLTICAGSRTETVIAGLGLTLPLTLTQEQVTYFAAPDLRAFAPDRFPVWIFHGQDRTFYGFPVYGEAAVKAARDMSGRFVTQQTRRFEPDPGQTAEVTEFLSRYLPGAVGPELVSKACVYDLTADRNFILDTVPSHPRIGLFVGAGHAAKFAGLIGHILADLAIDGRTGYPVGAFSMDRAAVRDPDFPSDFRFSRAAQALPGNAQGSTP